MRPINLSPEHQLWLSTQLLKRDVKKERNPLIKYFGHGPEGKKCGGCKHIFSKRFSRTYWKCKFRANTNGPGTDHGFRWDACGKYEQ